MPIYEYHCQACGYEFEKLRSFEERNLMSCPECGAKADIKISLANHTFGWRLSDESHLPGRHPDTLVRDI